MRSFSKAFRYNSKSKTIVFAIVFALFVLYAAVLLYPFVYAINIAVKENGRAFMRDPISVTLPFHFGNFIKAFKSLEVANTGFFGMTINSLWYAAGSTLGVLAASTCTAYVIAKYKFRGRGFIYSAAIVVMMIPLYGSMPAQYRLYSQLHIIDSPLILITTLSGFGSYFIYIHAFFKGLSWTYAEAAFIDGAGNLKVFFKIMVPMLLPSLSALAVMNFVGVWNDYSGPIVWLPNLPNLASGLYRYELNMQYTANQPVYFAGVFISLIPVITIFALFQNTIMTHVYTGGLKG